MEKRGRGRPPGYPRSGGRQKGTVNKAALNARAMAAELGVDPFEVLLLITKGDWESLGYTSAEITKAGKDGQTFTEDRITLDHRLTAAKEASKYIYQQLKAVEVSGPGGDPIQMRTAAFTKEEKFSFVEGAIARVIEARKK